ncbi:integrase catalytic domain-containing protein [Trichonephila inaurata madagascariensis]|uniref:Integrase catalytic domain-containing protein n=1 Tax=Trichonephila inaurata madagascariensis TaxID=2747483 RepID=A0A8X7C6H2_9ARAC|nr:integrase catalytic domain-containing protein [Trichonephila inaurata madagascariensis]
MPFTFQASKKGYKRLKNEPVSSNSVLRFSITLSWIKTPPHLLKTFVANRVAKIQELTLNLSWHRISSEINPADLVSRGLNVSDLINSPLWWKGPDTPIFTNDELLENINDCEVKKEFKISSIRKLIALQ